MTVRPAARNGVSSREATRSLQDVIMRRANPELGCRDAAGSARRRRSRRAESSKIDQLAGVGSRENVEIEPAKRSFECRQCGTELNTRLRAHRVIEDHPSLCFGAAPMPS